LVKIVILAQNHISLELTSKIVHQDESNKIKRQIEIT